MNRQPRPPMLLQRHPRAVAVAAVALVVTAAAARVLYGAGAASALDEFTTINTLAGNGAIGYAGDGGPATSASLAMPRAVTVDNAGNVYVADNYNNRVRKVSMNLTGGAGTITTVAGTGVAGFSGDGGLATAAQLRNPYGLHVRSDIVKYIYVTGRDPDARAVHSRSQGATRMRGRRATA